jgi:hypothetical protein
VPVIGPAEILVFLILAALIVYFALRRRVPAGILLLLVLVLSPPVAWSLAIFLGAVLSVVSGG